MREPGGAGSGRPGQPAGRPAVKVCGITRPEDARGAFAAGADYLGLVFAGSRRRVAVEQARALALSAPRAVWVGVFAGAEADEILAAAAAVPFAVAQLHGDEPPVTAARLRAAGLEVWQAVGVDEPPDWPAVEASLLRLAGSVDALVLDRRLGGRSGGSGAPFDWSAMPSRVRALLGGPAVRPASASPAAGSFVLSGGLSPENVARAVRRLAPDVLDVSSGVESRPGWKAASRVEAFVAAAREAARQRLAQADAAHGPEPTPGPGAAERPRSGNGGASRGAPDGARA